MDKRKITSCDMVVTNELILRNIFDFLPIRDLKNVRLTSHLWKDVCCPIFQRKSIVKLNENVHLEGSVMDNFLEKFATIPSTRVLFRNYKISLFNFDFNCDAMDAFWEKFGPSMESLQIEWVRFVGVDIVRDIFFNLTPNLKHLSIKDCSFYENYGGERPGLRIYKQVADVDENVPVNPNLISMHFCGGEKHTTLPISWEEIFRGFPNIRDLSFYNISAADTDGIMQIAKSLRTKNPRIMQLEKLNIFNGDYATGEIVVPIMDNLISLKLFLRELSIDLGATVNFHRTSLLLQQQRNARKMILYRGPLGTPMKKFPFDIIFPNLQYLEMTETVADCMEFLQFMPNLSTLALKEPPEVEPPFLPIDTIAKTDMNFTKMPLQTKLSTLIVEYDISSADVRKLVFWFPAVVKARLYLDNDAFRTVCGEWRKLEELEVLGERLDTEGITGIQETRSGETPVKKCNPINIKELKYLRKFIMVNYKISTTIDDVCVNEGFMKMPHLNYLELCTKHISEKGWTKLFNWAQLRTLIPTDGRWDSEVKAFEKGCYQLKSNRIGT